MVWRLGEIFGGKGRGERLHHQISIGHTDTATDNRTDVTEEGFPDFVSKLSHKLVSDDEIQAIFAGLRENRFKAIGGEVLELIDVETEIFTLVLWNILATHSGLLEFHHKDHTEKISINVAESAFREVNEENLLVIHDFADVEAGFNLTKRISHDGIREEWAPFRGEPSDDFTGIIRLLRGREFLSPIVINRLIGDIFQFRFYEFRVGETLRNIDKSSTGWVGH